uniref:Uncharacterized protein n=1 Tax=Anguilla anguilla TaxID=7936 RepID=A0A0E9UKN1_ANGAN
MWVIWCVLRGWLLEEQTTLKHLVSPLNKLRSLLLPTK